MKAPAFDYEKPRSVEAAVRLRAEAGEEARFLAGGQSLGPLLSLRLARPALLIDIRGIDALLAFGVEGDELVLGAGVTHAAIEDGCVAGPLGTFLGSVAHGIAYRAVRNRGTLGGSLAHADPAADWVSVMALLGAQLVAAGPHGSRSLPADALVDGPLSTVLGPGELVVAIRVPRPSAGARFSYYKFNRKPGEFAEAIAGIFSDPDRGVCRAVIGATDGAPAVIDDARALTDGRDPGSAEAAVSAAGFLPGTFEHHVHVVALRRARERLAS